ncbi:MAG: TonB family protein, partial [Epsilonproteobacteria bacterium]|nr:TonB family protein [Campylobacterota bacterium]
VRFDILPSGEVVNIKTWGAHKILQRAAKKTIKKASAYFPKPKERVTVTLSIEYRLR